MSRFRPINRDIDFLLPPSVQEWLPEGHLARDVVEVVEGLDLRELERAYAGRGSPPYHPARAFSVRLYGIAGPPQEIGAFSRREIIQHLPQRLPECVHRALARCAHGCFQLGKDLLNGVEIWAVGWQWLEGCTTGFNGFAHPRDRMGGQVVPDDDVARHQGGAEKFLHIGQEQRPIHGPGGHHRCDQPGLAHRQHQGGGLPMTLGHRAQDALTAWSPAPLPDHRRVQPGFIHEHQARRFPERLQRLPARPFQAHVRAVLFGGLQRFF